MATRSSAKIVCCRLGCIIKRVIYQSRIFDAFIDALVYLFGIYFCFDLTYSDCYKQALGLFHQLLFQELKYADVNRNLLYR